MSAPRARATGDLARRVEAASWRAGHWLVSRVLARTPAADLSWRVFDLFQHEGPRGVARRLWRRAGLGGAGAADWARVTAALAGPALPVVLAPAIEWDVTLFQRPQQLALAFAAEGRPTFYAVKHHGVGGVRPLCEGQPLWLVDELDPLLDRLEARPGRFVLVVFSTSPAWVSTEMLERLRGRAVLVYDFLDEQSPDVYAVDPSMRARHDWLLRHADVVSVTAARLREQVEPVRTDSVYCPNGADLTHFRVDRARVPLPADLAPITAAGPVVGYYGALASWFDFDLVRAAARARPRYQFVLIGVDYDRSLERSGLEREPNVHVLGPRKYGELPRYLAHFDVSTIPFVLNDVTESTSPIKLFEYMAGGRPIVTTDLRECRQYASVLIARGEAEYLAQLDRAMGLERDPAYASQLATDAEANGWPRRARDLLAAADRAARAGGEAGR